MNRYSNGSLFITPREQNFGAKYGANCPSGLNSVVKMGVTLAPSNRPGVVLGQRRSQGFLVRRTAQ